MKTMETAPLAFNARAKAEREAAGDDKTALLIVNRPLEAAEARLSSSRDEALEEAAQLVEQRTLPIPERQELAAAIRALKGQP